MSPLTLEQPSSAVESTSASYAADLEAEGWEVWLRTLFAEHLSDDYGQPIAFAEHHAEFWEWLWSLHRGERSRPFVAIWPRHGGKSTLVELALVALAAMDRRRYVLYVSESQDQADDHVGNVASTLESPLVEIFYPQVASRLIGKYGASRGWRRDRLRTASGFTIDAIGLDTAARGMKLEANRPDLIVLDDIDGENDTPETTEKKIKTLTRKILPAGARDLAVMAVQNLVKPESVFDQLARGQADFLADRIVSGPHPALMGLDYVERQPRTILTAGEPTWQGQDFERCQEIVDDVGIRAFLIEYQHEVAEVGGLFKREHWQSFYPELAIHNGAEPLYLVVDAAAKTGIHNDFSVASVWGEQDGKLLVFDRWRGRVEYPALKAAVRNLYDKWLPYGPSLTVAVEDASSGIALIQEMRQPEYTATGDVLAALPVIAIPTRNQALLARASVAAAPVAGGLVHLPDRAPWRVEWIEEHAQFPNGSHDDQVANTAIAIPLLRSSGHATQQLEDLFEQPIEMTVM